MITLYFSFSVKAFLEQVAFLKLAEAILLEHMVEHLSAKNVINNVVQYDQSEQSSVVEVTSFVRSIFTLGRCLSSWGEPELRQSCE